MHLCLTANGMNITWWGQTCFKIESKEGNLLINPPALASGLKKPKGSADIIIFSQAPPPKADWKSLLADNTTIIDSPGEYDLRGFFIYGISPTHSNSGNKTDNKKNSVILIIQKEGKNICHIADYHNNALSDKDLEQIGNIDILMIPVGGPEKKPITLTSEQAMKITQQIEPRVVIPMNYAVAGLKEKLDSVDDFLKEIGGENGEPQKKMSIKEKESLAGEGTGVVVIDLST